MGAVRAILAAMLLCTAVPASADSVATWRPFIAEASLRYNVPIAWIERVMRIESRGNARLRGRPTVSPAGAMGLMQLMPRTWTEMRALAGLGPDPFDPHDNILAGTLYLRLLYRRFGYPGLFGAYNAGPARYLDYLSGGRPLALETLRYMRDATHLLAEPSATAGASALFSEPQRDPEEHRGQVAPPLFAIRKAGY
jgi:soluble lytic murein transglycosylase-like protein